MKYYCGNTAPAAVVVDTIVVSVVERDLCVRLFSGRRTMLLMTMMNVGGSGGDKKGVGLEKLYSISRKKAAWLLTQQR